MYNACIIGFGYWGQKLARNFQNSELFNIISICDNKKKHLKIAKKDYPTINYYNNYKSAIKNNAIKLIY